MLHQWFTCVHLLDTYLANLKEGFQLSFHYPSVSIRAAQSGLQSVPAYRMRWVCHHLFRSYDRNPSNIANIRLYSASGHTICLQRYIILYEQRDIISDKKNNNRSKGTIFTLKPVNLPSFFLILNIKAWGPAMESLGTGVQRGKVLFTLLPFYLSTINPPLGCISTFRFPFLSTFTVFICDTGQSAFLSLLAVS